MLKIGLTGGIACGKSTVCQIFNAQGIPIVDADIIARDIVQLGSQCYQQIVELFGHHILQTDGQLNRQLLRRKIFTDPASKQRLESILHPVIRQQLLEQSQQVNAPYCILAIPLLIEAKMINLVDRVLVIDSDTKLQVARLCLRDGLTEQEANNILSQQCTQQSRLAHADDVINNNTSLDKLSAAVIQQHQKYMELANLISNGCQPSDSHGE